MDLQYYPVERIKKAADVITAAIHEQNINWIDQALILSRLYFRDQAGKYWFFDQFEQDWYFFEDTKWLLTSELPASLEGLVNVLPGEPEISDGPGDLDDATVVVSRSPQQTLKDSIRKIKEDYQAGWLSSQDAEVVAMRHYLIDQQGLFWVVGLESGDWYWKNEESWERASAPPEENELLKLVGSEQCSECDQPLGGVVICPNCGKENLLELPDLADDVYDRILEFLLETDSTPEPVTGEWDPPEGYPASIRDRFTLRT